MSTVAVVGGVVVTLHGADQALTGLVEVISGERQHTLTSQAIGKVVGSQEVGDVIDDAASVFFTFGANTGTKAAGGSPGSHASPY